jgi:hypothetical protein
VIKFTSCLLVHGRWFSPDTPASSTTNTGRHDIAEILLKVALNTNNQIKSSSIFKCTDSDYPLLYLQTLLITTRYVFNLSFSMHKKYPTSISFQLHYRARFMSTITLFIHLKTHFLLILFGCSSYLYMYN